MAKLSWFLLVCAMGCARASAPPEPDPGAAAEAPPAAAPSSPETAAASSSPSTAAAFELAQSRAVIRNATLQLSHADPVATTEQASALARAVGGFALDGSVQTAAGNVLSSMIVLRVPEPAFEKTLEAIRKLASLREESITGQDVTEEFVDVEARLRALRTLQGRLMGLLEHRATLTDLLQVEQEVARVNGEIERYEGRMRYLRERTQMATIQLTVQAPEQPYVPQPESVVSRLHNALRSSGEISLNVIESGIIALGFALPTALGAALFAWPVVWLRKRRRRAALAPSAPVGAAL